MKCMQVKMYVDAMRQSMHHKPADALHAPAGADPLKSCAIPLARGGLSLARGAAPRARGETPLARGGISRDEGSVPRRQGDRAPQEGSRSPGEGDDAPGFFDNRRTGPGEEGGLVWLGLSLAGAEGVFRAALMPPDGRQPWCTARQFSGDGIEQAQLNWTQSASNLKRKERFDI
jgi:hypothetical protein